MHFVNRFVSTKGVQYKYSKGNGQATGRKGQRTMKYNKSEIFKNAWKLRKMSMKWVQKLSFGECLRRAWAAAKEAVKATAESVKEIIMKGSEKQIKWANDIVETVTSILTAARETIVTEEAPADVKAAAVENINTKIDAIRGAEYAADIINLFKGIRKSGDIMADAQNVMAVYNVSVPMSDGEKKILGK